LSADYVAPVEDKVFHVEVLIFDPQPSCHYVTMW